jgi:hypothetical protein
MKRSVVIAVLGMAVALAACSGKTTEGNQQTPSGAASGSAASSTTQGSAAAPTNRLGHVGDTLELTNVKKESLAVTLSEIINPATGKLRPRGDSKDTYVAAMLTIKNTGTTFLKDDVNNTSALVGSNNQTYTPVFTGVTECTNFMAGVFELRDGESATGCVVFIMPPEVTPTKFKYTPSSGFSDDIGEWQIP